MSKTLHFEGCPACQLNKKESFSGLGALALPYDAKEYAMEVLQGSAAGAAVSLAVDFALPRIPVIGTMIPKNLSPVVGGLTSVLIGIYMKDKNPNIARGIAIGGVTAAMIKVATGFIPQLRLSGLGEVEVTEMSGWGEGEVEVTDSMGELVASEMSGMGDLTMTEIGDMEDYDDETF